MNNSQKLLIASFLFLAILTFVGPFYGDYCIADDCVYARVTKILSEDFEFNPWLVEAPMFPTYFLGFLFSLFFGFNHIILRISTMLLSIILFISLIYFFKKTSLSNETSILASLLISFNPFVFSLSHSFMADVPGLLFIVISSYFFLDWFDSNKKTSFVLALIFSVLGIYTRNFAVFVPLAAFFALLISNERKEKITSIIVLFLFLALNALIVLWFNYVLIGFDSHFHAAAALSNISRIYGIPVYLGFSFIGAAILLIDFFKEKKSILKPALLSLFLLTGALIAFFFIPLHPIMPYYGNILQSNGLGFLSLAGEKPFIPELFWTIMTVVSILSAFIFLNKIISKQNFLELVSRNKKTSFLFFSAVLYFLLMVFFNYFFDRFIVLILPFAFALFLLNISNSRLIKPVLLISILFFAGFSYYGTTDYFLARNAADKAIQSLEIERIAFNEIKANHEFCAQNFPRELHEGTACMDEGLATYWIVFSSLSNCKEKNSFEESFFFIKEKAFVLTECH
ncbi:MAG: glycosyltransferase family 39 protein [Candidatus Diapherotrites archaeon]